MVRAKKHHKPSIEVSVTPVQNFYYQWSLPVITALLYDAFLNDAGLSSTFSKQPLWTLQYSIAILLTKGWLTKTSVWCFRAIYHASLLSHFNRACLLAV